MISIFLLPHSLYSAHSNSDFCIFVTCCHHFTYEDNATITPHVLLLLFAIFLISICLPFYYWLHFSLLILPLAIDLCTLLVFKQSVLVVSPQFENQPRLTPLTFWLNWSSWPSSIFTFILLPCHTPCHTITSIPPYLWNQDTWFQEQGCNT